CEVEMIPNVKLSTACLAIVAMLGGGAIQPVCAGMVLAHAGISGSQTVTLQNTSSTQSAEVIFTASVGFTASASATRAASAAASVSGTIIRADTGQTIFSGSISAPPSQTLTFPQQSFTFDMAPGGSVTLSITGANAADATASSPRGSATAIATASNIN